MMWRLWRIRIFVRELRCTISGGHDWYSVQFKWGGYSECAYCGKVR